MEESGLKSHLWDRKRKEGRKNNCKLRVNITLSNNWYPDSLCLDPPWTFLWPWVIPYKLNQWLILTLHFTYTNIRGQKTHTANHRNVFLVLFILFWLQSEFNQCSHSGKNRGILCCNACVGLSSSSWSLWLYILMFQLALQ